MNTSQQKDSLRKKLKKFKKWKKVEKERSKNGDSIVAQPPPHPWEAKHRPPQSKNCSAIPVIEHHSVLFSIVSYDYIQHHSVYFSIIQHYLASFYVCVCSL